MNKEIKKLEDKLKEITKKRSIKDYHNKKYAKKRNKIKRTSKV
jgi:hypothetical protein